MRYWWHIDTISILILHNNSLIRSKKNKNLKPKKILHSNIHSNFITDILRFDTRSLNSISNILDSYAAIEIKLNIYIFNILTVNTS